MWLWDQLGLVCGGSQGDCGGMLGHQTGWEALGKLLVSQAVSCLMLISTHLV